MSLLGRGSELLAMKGPFVDLPSPVVMDDELLDLLTPGMSFELSETDDCCCWWLTLLRLPLWDRAELELNDEGGAMGGRPSKLLLFCCCFDDDDPVSFETNPLNLPSFFDFPPPPPSNPASEELKADELGCDLIIDDGGGPSRKAIRSAERSGPPARFFLPRSSSSLSPSSSIALGDRG